MTLLSPALVVLDGTPLNTADDGDGCTWVFTAAPGWHRGPGADVQRVQRIASHGEFAQRGHRTGRAFAVVGALVADTREPVGLAIEKLAALLADGGFGLFEFTDEDTGYRWANVQLADEPDLDWDGTASARFQLQLLATDPYKYGAV